MIDVIDRAINGAFMQTRSADAGTSKLGSSFWDIFNGVSKSGTPAVNYKSALKLSAFYNGVDMISNGIGVIPFGVYKKTDKGRERQEAHPVDWLLNDEPDGENGFLTPFQFKKLIGVSLKLRGNALFKTVSDGGGTQTVRFVPWEDVQDIKYNEKTYSLTYHLKNGEVLLAADVLHFKNMSIDGIVGLSAVQYGCYSMGVALQVQEFSYTNFENKGVRQGVVESDKVLAEAKDKIKAAWNSAMQTKSADRIVVLDDGMKFKPIMLSPQEAQIIESARFSIEDIARWLNIPLPKLKSLSQSTNNNIEQQSLDFLVDTLQPLVTDAEQEMKRKLLTRAERRAGLNIKGNMSVIVRGDMKARGEFYSKMANSGLYTPNEVRRLEELNDMAGGDELRFPVNTQTQAQIDNQNNGNEEDKPE